MSVSVAPFMPRRGLLVLAAALMVAPLAGCVDQGRPSLQLEGPDEKVPWGGGVQVSIRNTGDALASAPIPLTVSSANGTPVATFEDITGGRGIPVNGQTVFVWNQTNDASKPVLWGTYTVTVGGAQDTVRFEIDEPPKFAITVDAIPRVAEAGSPLEFRVNNTGNQPVSGEMVLAAGREQTVLYTLERRVEIAPGEGFSAFWNGNDPDGETPEADKYLIAVRIEPDAGPTPFAQDVFELT